MTSPLAPIIIQQPGIGQQAQQALAPLLRVVEMRRAFAQRKREIDIQRERLEIARMQAIKTGELTDEEILTQRTQRRANELKIKEAEQQIEGEREGLAIIGDISTQLAADDIAPGSDEFNDIIAEARAGTSNPHAQRTIDDFSGTQLTQEGLDAQIDATRQSIEIAGTQEERAQAGERRERRAMTIGERSEVAQRAVQSGISFGQAADLLGVEIPDELRDINPVAQQALASGRGRGSDMQQRATVFLTMMESSLGPMEAQLAVIEEKGGFNIITDAVARTNPKSFWGNLFASSLSGILDEEERAVVAYMRNFVANWQYFASGAQINEGEYSRLVDGFFPRSTDGEQTQQAKRMMRAAAINAITAMAAGDWLETPVDPLIQSLQQMKEIAEAPNSGVNQETINAINESLRDTRRFRVDLLDPSKSIVLGSPSFVLPNGETVNIGAGGTSREDTVDTILGGR